MTAVHPQLSPRCVQWRGICRSKTSGKPILTICPIRSATSSTRSVIITKSLVPKISWACCASCTLMAPSSLPLELRGSEHNNCTLWAQNTVDPLFRPLIYGGYPCFFFAAIDSEAARIFYGLAPSAMQKSCKITRCGYQKLNFGTFYTANGEYIWIVYLGSIG